MSKSTSKVTVVRSKTTGRFVASSYARRYPNRVVKQVVAKASK